MQGKVLEVNSIPLGDTTNATISSGATTITLYDTADFDEEGGQIQLPTGEIVNYSTKDDDADTITCSALPVGIAVDEPVQPYPIGEEKWALVQSDEEEDAILCLVPYNMQAIFDEGIRDEVDQETVDYGLVDAEWHILNVVADVPSISGTVVSDDSGRPLVPTTPPASSPAILRVTGTTSSLIVETDPPETGSSIEYHVSLTSGFVPSPGDPTTMVADTKAQVAVITGLADGTPLVLGTNYYVVTYAHNALGYAPTYSAEGSGVLNLDNLDEMIVQTVVAGFALFGTITVGQMTIDANTGITINAPGGGTILQFPVDGITPLSMTARLVTDLLNVQDNFSLSGTGQIYGEVLLNNGVDNPKGSPALTSGWPKSVSEMGDGSSSIRGFSAGLVEHPTNNTLLVRAGYFGGGFIRNIKKSDFTLGTFPDPSNGKTWCPSFNPMGGLTYVSGTGDYYLLGQDALRDAGWYIYRINGTTYNKTSEFFIGASDTFGGYDPRLVSDGTNVGMIWQLASGIVWLRWRNPTTYAQVGSDVNLIDLIGSGGFSGGRGHVGAAWYGDAGVGSNRLFVSMSNIPGFEKVLVFNPASSYAQVPTEFFDKPAILLGMAYDSVAGQFLSYDQKGSAYRHGKYTVDKSIKGKYAWLDPDATTSTHESIPGPLTTFTLPARKYLIIVTAAPPDINNTDAANFDKAVNVAFYGSDDGGTTWHRYVYTADPWGSTEASLAASTGTPKVTNEFLSSSTATPGRIRSTATDAGFDGFTNLIHLKGDGSFRLGNYSSVRHYGARRKTTGATQSLTNNAFTTITWGVNKETPAGLTYDNTNNQFVIAKSGLYLCEAFVYFDEGANATGRRGVIIQKNGSGWADTEGGVGVSTGISNMSCVALIPCVAGDTISVQAVQSSGSAKNVIGDDNRCFFAVGFMSQ